MVLYFYILHLSPNMYTAVLHMLGNTDSMNRSWHHFYTVYFVQYYELSNSSATNQGRQFTYNVTLRRVRKTIVAVETNDRYTTCLRIWSLRYPAWNARGPYCYMWPVPLYKSFPHYLINGTNFEKKNIERKFLYGIKVSQILHNPKKI